MAKKYKARRNSRITDDDAQIYGERIDTLIKENKGSITTKDVLDDAKDKKSPLHNHFEWDETKAAGEYRLQQARNLLSWVVEVVVISNNKSEQRSFMSVYDETKVKPPQMVYVTLKKATSKDSYRLQLINKIIVHLKNTTELLELFKQHD